jgi:hypothetical protein
MAAASSFDPLVGSLEECRRALQLVSTRVWEDVAPVRGVRKIYSVTLNGDDRANVLSELSDGNIRCGRRIIAVKKLDALKKWVVLWNDRFCLKLEKDNVVWLSISEGRDWVWQHRNATAAPPGLEHIVARPPLAPEEFPKLSSVPTTTERWASRRHSAARS